jgi:hypothetical protein
MNVGALPLIAIVTCAAIWLAWLRARRPVAAGV